MKCRQCLKKGIFLSLIALLVVGLSVTPIQIITVHADKSNSTKSETGFMIKSEKVDGQMDLLGTLQGDVRIKEGIIHGLTITKVLNTGTNQEPMIIKITSPGPVKVKNLHAETVNNSLPGIGGVCAPSKLGWLCLKDVVMEVTKQTVANISLPNTTIKACYKSECGGVPEYSPLSKKEIKKLLKDKNEQKEKLSKLDKGMKQNKQQLKTTGNVLQKAEKSFGKLEDSDSTDKLNKLTGNIRDLLDKDFSKNDNLSKKLTELINELEKEYKSYGKVSKTFTNLLDKASGKVQVLEKEIKAKKATLGELLKNDYSKVLEKKEQMAIYEKLLDKVRGKSNDSQSDENENDKELKPEKLKKELESLKKDLKQAKEKVDQLKKQKEAVKSKSDAINKNITDIKSTLQKKLAAIPSTNEQKDTEDSNQKKDKNSKQESGEDSGTDSTGKDDTGSDSTADSNSESDPTNGTSEREDTKTGSQKDKSESKNTKPGTSNKTNGNTGLTNGSNSGNETKDKNNNKHNPIEDLTDTLTDLLTGGLL